MNPALLLRRRYTLNAMYTRLKLQEAVRPFTLHTADDLLVAACSALGEIENGEFEAVLIAKALVHAKQIAGKDRGFVAARSGPDFEQGTLVGVRVFRNEHFFQLSREFFDLGS